MNASAERQIDRTLFEGPVVEVAATLPFRLQIDAEQSYVKEPLAAELHAPLASAVMKILFGAMRRHAEDNITVAAPPMHLIEAIEQGGLMKGGIRDVLRSFIGKPMESWTMPDDDTLVFDTTSKRHRLVLTKFAEDHYVTFTTYGNKMLWVVRVKDDIE